MDDEKGGKPAKRTDVIDYRHDEIPSHVRELIDTHLAIESEEAKKAGALGFMARAFTIATMPHRDPKTAVFERVNGDFSFMMMGRPKIGLPYGSIPRLLVAWVSSEAVRTKSPHLELGDSLADFLRALNLYRTGGKRGDITRLRDQMRKLFASHISVEYSGDTSWQIEHMQLAQKAMVWWDPQDENDAGIWKSTLDLSEPFYKEITEHPIPVDIRAITALKGSPLALDIYVWLTYRMSYLRRKTTIPWAALRGQFGAGYAMDEQGLRNFRRAFLRELARVVVLYPRCNVTDSERGLVLAPSPTHIPFATQKTLFGPDGETS